MAKNAITDYSQTPNNNTDIGGIGILGTNRPSNLDDGFRELMSQLADMNAGASPLYDTFTVRDPADATKTSRIDTGNQSTATERLLDSEALYRNGAFRETYITASGTHTFLATTRFFQIEAVAAGGCGGGVDGQGGGTMSAAPGGSSGYHGKTLVLDRAALVSGTVTIGAVGTAGTGATAGTDSADTTWSDGTNSFTWGGGKVGGSLTANSVGTIGTPTPAASKSGTLYGGGSIFGSSGDVVAGSVRVRSGSGGNTPLGAGGAPNIVNLAGSNGNDGAGYGAGGGGAAVSDINTNFTGGAGAPALMIVREW